MATDSNTQKPIVDFNSLQLGDVDRLIEEARAYKRSKQTNPVLVKGYVDSVGKHRNAILVAVAKLQQSEGVSPQRWQEVEEIMATLALDRYKDEATKHASK